MRYWTSDQERVGPARLEPDQNQTWTRCCDTRWPGRVVHQYSVLLHRWWWPGWCWRVKKSSYPGLDLTMWSIQARLNNLMYLVESDLFSRLSGQLSVFWLLTAVLPLTMMPVPASNMSCFMKWLQWLCMLPPCHCAMLILWRILCCVCTQDNPQTSVSTSPYICQ